MQTKLFSRHLFIAVTQTTFCLSLSLVTSISFGAEKPLMPVHSLSEFGPIQTQEEAVATAEKAMKKVEENGGGFVVLDPNTAADFLPPNHKQADINKPAVGFLDFRQGKIRFSPSSLGFRIPSEPAGYASVFLDRKINQETINPNGKDYIARISSSLVQGSASYFQDVVDQEPLPDSSLVRVYPSTTTGLYPGMHLKVFSGEAQTSRGNEFTSTSQLPATVKSLGWDKDKKLSYADLEFAADASPGKILRIINKSGAGALVLSDTRNTDSEGFTFSIRSNQFGVGDNFALNMYYAYMGNIMSTMGDEGGNAFTVDIWQLLDSFLGHVESWDPARQELVYTTDSLQVNTLGTSRPLINLNPSKWVTQGKAVVHTSNSPEAVPGEKEFVTGIDTNWNDQIVGRYFALDDPTEYAGFAREGQKTFWKHALRGRTVRRWWKITHYEKTESGEDRLWVERIRWKGYNRTAPSLLVPENAGTPLSYIIAPGAPVVNISDALTSINKTLVKEAPVMASKSDKRLIRLAPTSSTATALDFEPGDPVEQAVGPDPSHPNGYRVRHRQAMPGIRNEASFLSINNGNYPIYAAFSVQGSHDDMHAENQNKFRYGVNIAATSDAALRVAQKTSQAAILLESPAIADTQPIVWKHKNSTTHLYYDFQRKALIQTAQELDVSHATITQASGLSATSAQARNLRGINIPVPAEKLQIHVPFEQAEPDENYSLTVQPSWLTQSAVVKKTNAGFDVHFNTPAPDNATFDWQLIR